MNNFPLKTLKLGWVAFHSVTFQLKCLDFQSKQCKELVSVLSRFCNGLLEIGGGVAIYFCRIAFFGGGGGGATKNVQESPATTANSLPQN